LRSISALAWAMTNSLPSARQEIDLVGDRPLVTFRYGVSMNPNSFVRVRGQDEIRPMFGLPASRSTDPAVVRR